MDSVWLVCSECGKIFEDMMYPANTHPDSDPMCSQCIEAMLDRIKPVALSEAAIKRIVDKALNQRRGT